MARLCHFLTLLVLVLTASCTGVLNGISQEELNSGASLNISLSPSGVQTQSNSFSESESSQTGGGAYYDTLVTLQNGKVLKIGGQYSVTDTASDKAFLFDPATNTWSSGGTMTRCHGQGHTSTLLNDGRVLVVGGERCDGTLTSTFVELYDPGTNTWTGATTTNNNHSWHAATKLSDGRVMIVGGYDGTCTRKTEIFDPSTGNWTTKADAPYDIDTQHLVALSNGNVLMFGGSACGTATTNTRLYNITGNTWSGAQPAPTIPRCGSSVVTLPDGNLMFMGGESTIFTTSEATTDIYNVSGGSWTAGQNLFAPTTNFAAGILPGGQIVIAGGVSNTTTYSAVDIVQEQSSYTGTWNSVATANTFRTKLSSGTVLQDGRFLFVGGMDLYDDKINYGIYSVYSPLTLSASGGTSPYTFSITSGLGALLSATTLLPHASGNLVLGVQDASGRTGSLTIQVQ